MTTAEMVIRDIGAPDFDATKRALDFDPEAEGPEIPVFHEEPWHDLAACLLSPREFYHAVTGRDDFTSAYQIIKETLDENIVDVEIVEDTGETVSA